MAVVQDVPWWQRVLVAMSALLVTAVLVTIVIVLRDLKRDRDFHWGNAGEEQLVGYFLFLFAGLLFPRMLLVVVPLVLLIPARYQQRNWSAMLGIASLLPPLLEALLLRHSPSRILHHIQDSPEIFLAFEVAALVCCGLYLLSLRWLGIRRNAVA